MQSRIGILGAKQLEKEKRKIVKKVLGPKTEAKDGSEDQGTRDEPYRNIRNHGRNQT